MIGLEGIIPPPQGYEDGTVAGSKDASQGPAAGFVPSPELEASYAKTIRINKIREKLADELSAEVASKGALPDEYYLEVNDSLPRNPSKQALREFGVNKGLFSLNNEHPPPAIPFANPVTGQPTGPSGSGLGYERTRPSSPPLPHINRQDKPPSRVLSIALALIHPSQRDSVLRTIFEVENSPNAADEVPDKLKSGFDNLESRLTTDPTFRQQLFTYLKYKMDSPHNPYAEGKSSTIIPGDLFAKTVDRS